MQQLFSFIRLVREPDSSPVQSETRHGGGVFGAEDVIPPKKGTSRQRRKEGQFMDGRWMIFKRKSSHHFRMTAGLGVLLLVLALSAPPVLGFSLKTGNPDFEVRFDNTLTYSAVARVKDQNEELLSDSNTDDAERNFDKGLIMNRFDLLSELDLIYKRFGVRLSGAAWYDTVYNTTNDNDSPTTVNQTSVDYNEFTDDAEKWHGKGGELLDAFTWGALDLGDMTLRYKLGQFAVLWGETFFPNIGANGITGALAPINVAKAATVPNATFKEFIMPVPQATVGLQMTDNLEFGAVYQFKWEPNRLFAAGSYYSPADMVGPLGAEQILAGPDNLGLAFGRSDDVDASDDGQFGVQLKYSSPWGMELGLYALNVHSRDFYIVTGLEMGTPPGAPPFVHEPLPDYYYYLYPEDIEYYGLTASTNVGKYPLAMEVTYRRNAPLASESITLMPGESFDNDDDPLYPVGQTLHVALTSFSPGNVGGAVCDEYDLILEVGVDHLLEVDKNEDMLNPDTKDTAVMAQVAITPKWHQVLPGLDVYLPMGLGYAFEGRASGMQGGTFGNHEGGSWNIGVEAWYNAVWKTGIAYTDYFGDIEDQHWKDRDTVGFYVTRTF
jgi:hypothetical protein